MMSYHAGGGGGYGGGAAGAGGMQGGGGFAQGGGGAFGGAQGEECGACGVSCGGGGAGAGGLSYVGTGQGAYVQETTYKYVLTTSGGVRGFVPTRQGQPDQRKGELQERN